MNRRAFLATLPVVSRLRQLRLEQQDGGFRLDQEDQPVAFLRTAYLQDVRSDRATLMWSTFEAGSGEVEYSADGVNFEYVRASSQTFLPSETHLFYPFTQYRAELKNLTPNTTYFYRALVNRQLANFRNDSNFRTAGAGPFTFLVFGDSGQGTSEQSSVAATMSAEKAAFVLHTGDVAYYSGTYGQYQTFHFDIYRSLMSSTPFYASPGNHDCETNNGQPYLSLHSFPKENVPALDQNRYYSFDWGNAHIVSIDSVVSLGLAINGGGPMLRWLEEDLRSTRQFWRIALIHYPPYSTGPNERDVRAFWVRTRVVPILEAYGVQLVLSGDEHSFQRSRALRDGRIVPDNKGTMYYTSGGGGANLYFVDLTNPVIAFGASEHHYLRVEVNGTQMRIRAIRQNGLELDRFDLSPYPIFSGHANSGSFLTSSTSAASTPVPSVSFYAVPGGGTLIRITGNSLAAEETTACTWPVPQELAGTSVSITGGMKLPLYYVSHDQIYAELPEGITGPLGLRVTTANGFVETVVNVP